MRGTQALYRVKTGCNLTAGLLTALHALNLGLMDTYALLMQVFPVSLTFVRKMMRVPSFHISTTSVCPGSTGDANRTLMALMTSPAGSQHSACQGEPLPTIDRVLIAPARCFT